MSLATVTHGYLWPQAVIVREQFKRLEVNLADQPVFQIDLPSNKFKIQLSITCDK